MSNSHLALYDDLVDWYRLIDPAEDHLDEALCFQAAFEGAVPGAASLLELGAGAGHNAVHLKRRFRCTLTDVSAPMLRLSQELNPECEHREGDMRTQRLGRTFDVVLVHDAICYMTTPEDLRATLATAFAHTRPGGAALFAPDEVAETFAESTHLHQADIGQRSLRCLEWFWDPDPHDTWCRADYAFLLRDGEEVRAVHDCHRTGLFSRSTWVELLTDVGFAVGTVTRPIGDGATDEVFFCRRQ